MVARGDTAEDLAAAIDPLLAAPDLASRLGDAARLAAVADFDWEVVGARLADTLLACAGDPPPVA
jgi:glycosyltransferase involved in cell wall biosynthesis